jgi:peroxiredoxin
MIRTLLLHALAPAMLVAALAPPAMAQVKAGDRLPAAFQPVDHNGAAQSLESLAGAKGLVLILSRSAGWCPVCQAQMVQLKAAAAPLAARGYGLAVMTYDAPPVLARFATRQQLPYPLLSDQGSRVIRAMGLADPQYPPGHMAHGVPLASVLVIDRSGTIQRAEISPDFRKRPSVEEIMAMAPAR